MTAEFENVLSTQCENHHHEQQLAVQETFMTEVMSLNVGMENPFLEDSQDLLVLDSEDIMDKSVAQTKEKVETLGAEQYKTFVEESLELQTKSVTDIIPKNKMPLLS